MSQGNYTITTRAVGTVLTATIYNADHQNHVTNQNPAGTGAYSDTVAQMQTTRSPGSVGAESLAGSLADEIASLRYMIQQINGQPQWYSPSPYPFQQPSVVNKSTNYTVAANDTTSYFNATAAMDFSLPALAGVAASQPFYFKNSSTAKVRIVPNGADTIDGANAAIRVPAYEFIMLVSTAGGWIIRQKPSHDVGDLYPTSRQSAGIGELLAYGQPLSRTTYSGLASVLQIATTGTTTNANNSITGIPSTAGMDVGMAIECPNLPAGTTITAISSGTAITVSNNATAGGSGVSLTVWPHGGGDGSTTFNAPDVRGRGIAGADIMGGTNANRLNSANTGGVPGSNVGIAGGEKQHTMTQAELVAHQHNFTAGNTIGLGGSGGSEGYATAAMNVVRGSNTTSTGSTTPFNVIQPTLQENYVVKL